MPRLTVRLNDSEATDLANLAHKTGRSRSVVVRGLVVAEAERVSDKPPLPPVADTQECLELLTTAARRGSVAAIRALLDRTTETDKEQENPFAMLDELGPRRSRSTYCNGSTKEPK